MPGSSPSTVSTVAERGTPAASAIAAMLLPVPVAVVNVLPTDKRASLSKTTWIKLDGR